METGNFLSHENCFTEHSLCFQEAAPSANSEDVPLLMEVVNIRDDGIDDSTFEDREDVPLLGSTSSCEETGNVIIIFLLVNYMFL